MRIISPVDNLAETEQLLDAGADELYGGVAPDSWGENYSRLVSYNQRTFDTAQIPSYDDFAAIVALTKSRGRRFALTLNAPFYSDKQIELLAELTGKAIDTGIDQVILADIGLVRALRKTFPDLELHVSTMAHLSNSLAAREYLEQGCKRLVLERHMSVDEIGTVIRDLPGATFDVFMLVGKCPNTEGLCSFHHASSDRIWPCEIPYQISADEGEASAVLDAAMQRQRSWAETNRRHACGLCAIPALLEIGVSGLKLVGRGAPAAQKVANILLVKDFLRQAGEEGDLESYRSRARAAYRQRFGHACSPNVCYFPEFYRAE